jgi:hypothetical protein
VGCDQLPVGAHGKEEVDRSHRASVAVDPFTTADGVNLDWRWLWVTGEDNREDVSLSESYGKRPAKSIFSLEHFTNVDL